MIMAPAATEGYTLASQQDKQPKKMKKTNKKTGQSESDNPIANQPIRGLTCLLGSY